MLDFSALHFLKNSKIKTSKLSCKKCYVTTRGGLLEWDTTEGWGEKTKKCE